MYAGICGGVKGVGRWRGDECAGLHEYTRIQEHACKLVSGVLVHMHEG